MTFAFDLATAVTDNGNGVYSGAVHDGWDIRGNANGGYVMALLANAMRSAANRPDPISITLHYLAPLPPGDFEIITQVVKQGRRFTTVSASMMFGGREAVRAIGAFSEARQLMVQCDITARHSATFLHLRSACAEPQKAKTFRLHS